MRKVLFWVHLVAGVVASAVIALMSLTGAMLVSEGAVLAWAARDVSPVVPPFAAAERLPVDELVRRAETARERPVDPAAAAGPRPRASAVTLRSDPQAAAVVSFGRTDTLHVHPYTGAVQTSRQGAWHHFFHRVEDWHRALGLDGERRPIGRAITGACNAAFLALALTGPFLWWPRTWTWRRVRGVLLFDRSARGKARDWNWHHVLGIWSAPVLVVLTATGVVMSYRWANNLVYTATGSPPPPASAGPRGGPSGPAIAPPYAGARPLPLEALALFAQRQVPDWESLSIRLAGSPRGNPPPGAAAGERAAAPGRAAVAIAVKTRDPWPLFAQTQLTFDPFTGAVLRQESYEDGSPGRKLRLWIRYLHTGEALGAAGQVVAAVASLAALVLVWTGLALTWRRFFRPRS